MQVRFLPRPLLKLYNMVIDNFDLISKHLEFTSPDDFYFVQVFVRGKDGRKANVDGGLIGGNNKNRLVRIWTIRSIDELFKAKPDIISIANSVGGRVYIHPTKRSFKEVARECMRLTTESYLSENYQGLKGSYSSACGISYVTSDKKFIIDLDYNKDFQDTSEGFYIGDYIDCLNNECDPVNTEKLEYIVPTAHGMHLITRPFNIAKFKNKFPLVDIHKNNPTLLYFSE